MDFSYFRAPYYTGMPADGFVHNAGPDAIHSIEPLEPLDAGLLAGTCDAFPFGNEMAPAQGHGSPDPAAVGSVDSGIGGEEAEDHNNAGSRTRSSSEERETAGLTPAQSRRKAQNRAAQRAFRERKERHVRDLEAKLSALENSAHSLQSDNERLKLALQRARTENEILRATSRHPPTASRPVSASYPSPGAHLPNDEEGDDPYNVQVLSNGSVIHSAADQEHAAASRPKNVSRELSPSQMWDLIQAHPLVKQGAVDLAHVCAQLKGGVKCDGRGPVVEESAIRAAIERARRSGGDELI